MRIGTRGSQLGRWRANHVAARLRAAGHEVTIVAIESAGDQPDAALRLADSSVPSTHALDEAVLDGRIDLAVHALEEIPPVLDDGVVLAAVSARADPRDAFVAHDDFAGGFADLPAGATVAVSSLRQQAQLRAWRPDLQIVWGHGPVPERMQQLSDSGALANGGWHGIVLPEAMLRRLGLEESIRAVVAPSILLPAAGQGALGVICAAANTTVRSLLVRLLEDDATRTTTQAERAFRRQLGASRPAAIGAYARLETGSVFVIEGVVASGDGTQVFRGGQKGTPSEAEDLARALAHELRARGAGRLLSPTAAETAADVD